MRSVTSSTSGNKMLVKLSQRIFAFVSTVAFGFMHATMPENLKIEIIDYFSVSFPCLKPKAYQFKMTFELAFELAFGMSMLVKLPLDLKKKYHILIFILSDWLSKIDWVRFHRVLHRRFFNYHEFSACGLHFSAKFISFCHATLPLLSIYVVLAIQFRRLRRRTYLRGLPAACALRAQWLASLADNVLA